MSKPSVKAALIQHQNQGDAHANLALIGEQIAAAAAQGAQLILLQELHNGPYFCQTEDPSRFDLAEAIPGRKGRPYLPMDVLLIRPSQNLGEVAHQVIRKTNLRRYSGVMARWLRRTMQGDEMPENDLASYVLFDPDYLKTLMHLGYHDAEARHADIAALFG